MPASQLFQCLKILPPPEGSVSRMASHPNKRALTSEGSSCSGLDCILHLPALQSPACHGDLSIPFGDRPKGMLALFSVPITGVCTAHLWAHGCCAYYRGHYLLMWKAWGCFALGTNSSSLLDEEEILSLAAREEKVQEMFRRESLVHISSNTYK